MNHTYPSLALPYFPPSYNSQQPLRKRQWLAGCCTARRTLVRCIWSRLPFRNKTRRMTPTVHTQGMPRKRSLGTQCRHGYTTSWLHHTSWMLEQLFPYDWHNWKNAKRQKLGSQHARLQKYTWKDSSSSPQPKGWHFQLVTSCIDKRTSMWAQGFRAGSRGINPACAEMLWAVFKSCIADSQRHCQASITSSQS